MNMDLRSFLIAISRDGTADQYIYGRAAPNRSGVAGVSLTDTPEDALRCPSLTNAAAFIKQLDRSGMRVDAIRIINLKSEEDAHHDH